MAQVRGSAVLAMVTISIMLFHCQAATTTTLDWKYGGEYGVQYLKQGDTLTFQNNPIGGSHNVVPVTPTGYANCNAGASNALPPSQTITFKNKGTFYYICSFAGHCIKDAKATMRVKVVVK